MKTLTPLLLTILIFAGCSEHIASGGKDANTSGETNTTTSDTTLSPGGEVIHGHVLPPEPDPAVNNATLLGIDTNDNGVRDDVERWIYLTYDEPVEIGLFMQLGHAYQKVIVDPSKAMETKQYMHDQLSCNFYWVFDAKDANETFSIEPFRNLESEIKPIQFNTMDRHMAYERYNAVFHGTVLDQVSHDKNKCRFDEYGHIKAIP